MSRAELDADALLAGAKRPLVIGIGGGGDVVGALATAESARLAHGSRPVVGGVTWERRPIDPQPGPRTVAEIEGGRELGPGVLAATPDTRIRASGIAFGESRMAGFLGEETVLVDPNGGPAAIATGLTAAAAALGADLVVFVDVGGDALAHGDEPGLASPLCDSLLLAAAARMAAAGVPTLGGLFGIGCDGELAPAEVNARLAEIGAAGGLAGARGLTAAVAARLEGAIEHVPTEASAMALLAFRGQTGPTPIRGGRRTVELTMGAALTVYFDIPTAVASAAHLPALVDPARSLDEANAALNRAGVRTELDYERHHAAEDGTG
ncbi:MAG: hypothetical protein QOE06_43 [Thermoleophilaceae bacterium]|nr:hypothetical protein [Thermoleophilaceae bacterium]